MPSIASYDLPLNPPTGPMRMADAASRMCRAVAKSGKVPKRGGDRPRVVITFDYQTLLEGVGHAENLADGTLLAPSEARLLACDCDVIPMVLGSKGQPLDIGRSQRLFNGPISKALAVRDKGCAFPGCDAPPEACDRHHCVPWWAGDRTSLKDGVLLCPYHHRMVEPDRCKPFDSQWIITIDPESGLPWFTPPRSIDPERKPRQHHRYQVRGRTLPPPPEAFPQPPPKRPPTPQSPAWISTE